MAPPVERDTDQPVRSKPSSLAITSPRCFQSVSFQLYTRTWLALLISPFAVNSVTVPIASALPSEESETVDNNPTGMGSGNVAGTVCSPTMSDPSCCQPELTKLNTRTYVKALSGTILEIALIPTATMPPSPESETKPPILSSRGPSWPSMSSPS